jgi:hypothetical protein
VGVSRTSTPSTRAPLGEVEGETVGRHRAQLTAEITASSHRGTDPREQLLDPEGLGDVVVGTQVQGLDLVVGLLASRQNDDRYGRGRPDPAQHLRSVDVGQPEVEDDHIGRILVYRLHRRAPVARRDDLVAGGAQSDPQGAPQK